jgi:hypothetical protein
MDRDAGVDVRLHAIGEGAVISDREGQEQRRYPNDSMHRRDGSGRGSRSGEPPVHPQRQSELRHRQPQDAGGEPGLERQGVCRGAPEERGSGVVGGVLGPEYVEPRGDRQGDRSDERGSEAQGKP